MRCSICAAETVALAAIFSVMDRPKSFLSILLGRAVAVLPKPGCGRALAGGRCSSRA